MTAAGVCPICGADFNCTPQVDDEDGGMRPPSLMLEVGMSADRRPPMPWRLSVPGTQLHRESGNPPFTKAKWTYALCGNGHYFLVEVAGQRYWRRSRLDFRDQSFAAAIGPVASGKSYLLVRTLNQPLLPESRDYYEANPPMPTSRNDPLEAVPKTTLENHYRKTGGNHEPIPATMRQELVPAEILAERVSDELYDAVEALQKEVMRRPRADKWGTVVRQPITLRYDSPGGPVLTCVADLAGELFDAPQHQFASNEFQGTNDLETIMPWCNSIVWVIDPLHGEEPVFQEYLAAALQDDELYRRALTGSSRPDERRAGRGTVEQDIDKRSSMFARIAERLAAGDSELASELGGTHRNLVVISKCDLFKLALRKSGLDDFGQPGSVRRGVAIYLDHLARRRVPGTAAEDVEKLLEYLGTGRAEDRYARSDQVADGLVEHYSDSEAFWDLVHRGGQAGEHNSLHTETITLDAADDYVRQQRTVVVPTADEHLKACLLPGGADLLQMRDLVMSALGCGIMFGLGHGNDVRHLLGQRWQAQQFFLCSPLGTVPLGDDRVGNRMTPMAGGRYPSVKGRSAGMQQLLLRILKEALP